MLFEIHEIQRRLDEQFLPLEPMLTGFRLVSTEVGQEAVKSLSEQLNVVLPEHFKSILQQFDLGEFTIGPIAFCNMGNFFAWIVENNRDDVPNESRWWGSAKRPSDLLLIANSDPYAVLMNNTTGGISVFKHGDSWRDTQIIVADNFALFLRGLGTVFIQRNDKGNNSALANDVSNEAGGGSENVFWQWLAE